MWPNPQFPADLVTFTEEIINGKLHFLCSAKRPMNQFGKNGLTIEKFHKHARSSKAHYKAESYERPSKRSMMERFCENSYQVLAANSLLLNLHHRCFTGSKIRFYKTSVKIPKAYSKPSRISTMEVLL